MANNSIPPRPTGSDPEAFFMQRVWDCCFDGWQIQQSDLNTSCLYNPYNISTVLS